MNIEHVKLFARVAATSNISLAGKEFGLSPAVSSSYISKLEESLGIRLVHRTTRKVSLTEEGQAFLPHALHVLESVDQARASVGAGSAFPQGNLRVTAPASFGRMHLIPALNGFLNTYPDLTVDMHLSDRIVDMVEGGFDVAIRDAALNDSTLIARKLASDNRILCASPDYIRKYGTPASPQDLKQHRCINLAGLETWVFDVDGKDQNVKINSVLRTDNGEAARDACVSGVGITLSSTWCCYQQIERGELVEILHDFPLVSYTNIWAVYPSSRLLAPKVRAFIDYYSQCFQQRPYWESVFK